MISPVFKCHHKSGSWNRSRTVKTASKTSAVPNMAGNESTLRTRLGEGSVPVVGATSSNIFVDLLERRRFDQAVQVRPRDVEAFSSQCLVALTVFDRLHGELVLVVAEQPFEVPQLCNVVGGNLRIL